MNEKRTTRIAAVGDIHVKEKDKGKWAEHFAALSEQADVLLLCGDLTDTGRPQEAEALVRELEACRIPVLGVLGNHDYESNNQQEVIETIKDSMQLLDGDAVVVNGIGFAGVKGFGGGFDRYKMPAYGEAINKTFVQEVLDERQKLENALQKLEEENGNIKKVAILHYAPIEATIIGEPVQIHSFLGSSYLAEPLDRHKVEVAFHGHAHIGTLEGKTSGGTKVFNVAAAVLRNNGLKKPFYMLEV